MSSRKMIPCDHLLRKELYLETVQRYVKEPLQSEADDNRFLHVLQQCLDHVLKTSPALFPQILETILPRFGNDEAVIFLLGKCCMGEEMYTEAEFFLRRILTDINSDCLSAKESLQTMYDVIVPRWHFVMLNDVARNSAYSHVIANRVGSIPDCSVLDIGSGTGLLSMLAVRSGASNVFACELNFTMVTMSHDILRANQMEERVKIIHKTSTEVTVPTDLPERVCLVVTETVDAGLLGEAIVPTLRHAWSHLLLPKQPPGVANQIARCGHVIPCGATVYVMAIECPEIARQSRLLTEEVGGVSFHGIALEGSCKGACETEPAGQVGRGTSLKGRMSGLCREPYTCERLNCIRSGYRDLTGSCAALKFDFTDPMIPLPSAQLCVPVVMPGHLDAIAMHFDLNLDPTTSISTSPHSNENHSWDQAVYPVTMSEGERIIKAVWVAKGDTLHLRATCTDTLVHISVDRIERGSEYQQMKPHEGVTVEWPVSGLPVHFVDRAALSRLNDGSYFAVYKSAISHALEVLLSDDTNSSSSSAESSELGSSVAGIQLGMETGHSNGTELGLSGEGSKMETDKSQTDGEDDPADCIVLDMTHELPIVGIMAATMGVDFVQIGRCHSVYESLLDAIISNNNLQQNTSIKWVEPGSTSAPQLVWDMVLCDVVSPQGTLRNGIFEELGAIRAWHTHSDTVILPFKVAVHSVGISSSDLRARTAVLGSVPTLGLDIARFINKYQISHFIDVDMWSMAHERLTEETQLLTVDFASLSTKPFTLESSVCVKVTGSGNLTGFVYWFTLHFPNGETIDTGIQGSESHWHQAVFCLAEDIPLQTEQNIKIRALIRDSYLDITLLSTE